jgi:hypothetical protein
MKEEEGNRKPRGESGRLKLTNLKLKTPPRRPEGRGIGILPMIPPDNIGRMPMPLRMLKT